MSRKNRRRTFNSPMKKVLLNSVPTKGGHSDALITSSVAAPTWLAPTVPQNTPFFELSPIGGVRVALSSECWCEMQNVSSCDLQSDPVYQRAVNAGHVREISDDWDARVMNFPKVSLRHGSYYIFDGAHTKTAAGKRNEGQEFLVPCIVYHNLKLEDEAYLFAMQNGCSKEVAFGYKLNARIISGDVKAKGFLACNNQLGLKIVKEDKTSWNVISAVNTAYRLYETWGEKRYLDVMSLILDTWKGDPSSFSQVVIEGMSRFFRAYDDVFDRNRFMRDLSVVNVKQLAEKSRGHMRDTAQAMANNITQAYNRKGGKGCVKADWLCVLELMRKDEQLHNVAAND